MLVKKSFSLLVLSVFVFCACEEHVSTENKELEKKLVGEWNSTSLKITMNTFGNKDTTRIFEVEEKDWQDKMNIRPVRTIYFADGTYLAEHRNLNDSIIFNPFGVWKIMDDTIILRDTFPQPGPEYKYKIVINNNIAEFNGKEDCDNDGKADDDYQGFQRKRSVK